MKATINYGNKKIKNISNLKTINKKKVKKYLKNNCSKWRETNRELQYMNSYKNIHEENLLRKNIDLSNLLKIHDINNTSRGKMIDWLVEVINNFECDGHDYTFFRTIFLIDLFLKNTNISYKNEDILYIGVACLFIASKIEDIYEINLNDLLKFAAKNKFSNIEIIKFEKIILKSIGYYLTLPNPLTYIDFYLTKNFLVENMELSFFYNNYKLSSIFSSIIKNTVDILTSNILELRIITIYIMRILWLNFEFFQFDFKSISISVIIFSITLLYDNYIYKYSNNLNNDEKEAILLERKEIINNIEKNNNISVYLIKKILNLIETHIQNLDIKYVFIKNLKDLTLFKKSKELILNNN